MFDSEVVEKYVWQDRYCVRLLNINPFMTTTVQNNTTHTIGGTLNTYKDTGTTHTKKVQV